MKAWTVRQPWAGLIVDGIKDVENKKVRTHFRGRICVHAAQKRWSGSEAEDAPASRHQIYLGAVIGTVEIVNCIRNSSSEWAIPGMWHWVLAEPRALRSPIPTPGRLGLWDFPDRRLPLRHLY
ncbi:MAG TPA: hypothetical protein VMV09_03405 [Candidatus Saccharimonadales bacterium]|nr:hypothetical protein [Candidatus Saccharimonadales bacterium]